MPGKKPLDTAGEERGPAAPAPRAWVREVAIEAVGGDFALLSGEWLEDVRLACCLRAAERAWAFAAEAGEGAGLLALERARHACGAEAGAVQAEDGAAVARLLGDEEAREALARGGMAGFFLSPAPRGCGRCCGGRCGEKARECARDATNANT